MAEQQIDDPLFDYKIYRFGRSRQIFRGPQPDLRGPYISFIGASHTFGRYVDEPFPTLVSDEVGLTALNFGTDGAGPNFFLSDPEIVRAAGRANVCVLQIMCAWAQSNRMYTVRPRRNVRLHAVSDLMCGIFPEVDFERFSFVKPMLAHLQTLDEHRFKLVVNEMKNAWIGRMQSLISAIDTKVILLWLSQRDPDEMGADVGHGETGIYPEFVDRSMINAIKGAADGYVECTTSVGIPQDLRVDGRAVLFRPSGEPIDQNREFPSPEMHEDAACALIPQIERLLDQ